MWYTFIAVFQPRRFFRGEKFFRRAFKTFAKSVLSQIRNKQPYFKNTEKRPILSKFIAFLRGWNTFFRRLRYSNRLYQISQALSRANSRFRERSPIFRKNVKKRLQFRGSGKPPPPKRRSKGRPNDKVHKNFIICRDFPNAAKSPSFFSRPTARSRANAERRCLRKVRAPTDDDSG